jgi:hypothetical protein
MTEAERYLAFVALFSDLMDALKEIAFLKTEDYDLGPEIAMDAIVKARKALKQKKEA